MANETQSWDEIKGKLGLYRTAFDPATGNYVEIIGHDVKCGDMLIRVQDGNSVYHAWRTWDALTDYCL